ncbi:MAG: DHH family phosphoesterase [Candidatus Methanomethylophilaceae archaeon]|nr:DHH family phosphoesterase [Candidatus Methanomethylophilaceae archaeon]
MQKGLIPMNDFQRFQDKSREAASLVNESETALVVAHIDADGISAAAIASAALERAGKSHDVVFVKKMDDEAVELINSSSAELVWVVDLGSGYVSRFKHPSVLISDHHVPEKDEHGSPVQVDNVLHVNPNLYHLDGGQEISGAGVTYMVAREMDPANMDLSYLAVVGAAGDFQDSSTGRFMGCNRAILQDAEAMGLVQVDEDLRLFGRETRPLVQFLQFASDTPLPGLSNNNTGCHRFLDDLGVDLKRQGRWRCWNDLDEDERERVRQAIAHLLSSQGLDPGVLFGETYTLPTQPRGSELRDAKEFATLLNSCGRYDDAPIGLRICLGDAQAVREARDNRSEHKKQLSMALSMVRDNNMIKERGWVQFFHAGGEVRETIVGITAGMLLGSNGVRRDIPMIAFAHTDDGEVKVSARADRSLVDRGLDLSAAMRVASELVGGYGGGHNIAAGATIPLGKEEEFLDIVEDIVSAQLI